MIITLSDLGLGSYTVTVGSVHERVLHFSGKLITGTVIAAYQKGSVGFARFRTGNGDETIVPAVKVKDSAGSLGCFTPPALSPHLLCS